eukprot:19156-Pyramimonas_sp.AAC.1
MPNRHAYATEWRELSDFVIPIYRDPYPLLDSSYLPRMTAPLLVICLGHPSRCGRRPATCHHLLEAPLVICWRHPSCHDRRPATARARTPS